MRNGNFGNREKLLFAQYGKYYKQCNKEKVLYITNLFSWEDLVRLFLFILSSQCFTIGKNNTIKTSHWFPLLDM